LAPLFILLQWPTRRTLDAAIQGAELLLNAGGAGIRLVPRAAWANRQGLRAVADVNAVPPVGIEGIEVQDDGVEREGSVAFGALGVGNFKMKIHRACVGSPLRAERPACSTPKRSPTSAARFSRFPGVGPSVPRSLASIPGTVTIDLCGLDG
jgi:hypothetical protein